MAKDRVIKQVQHNIKAEAASKATARQQAANTADPLVNALHQLAIRGLLPEDVKKKFQNKQMTREEAAKVWNEISTSRIKATQKKIKDKIDEML